MRSMEKKIDVVTAACCLHNLCIMEKDMNTRRLEMGIEDVSVVLYFVLNTKYAE